MVIMVSKHTIKILCLSLIIILMFSFIGCNNSNDNVNLETYKDNAVFFFEIFNPSHSFLFIYTKDHKVVTFDEIENKTVVSTVEEHNQWLIASWLDSISQCEANDIEFNPGANDVSEVILHLNDNEYYFTYGVSEEPYVNMLVELIIGCSNCEAAEDNLVPYPSKFR